MSEEKKTPLSKSWIFSMAKNPSFFEGVRVDDILNSPDISKVAEIFNDAFEHAVLTLPIRESSGLIEFQNYMLKMKESLANKD
jgi:hypothetical protein